MLYDQPLNIPKQTFRVLKVAQQAGCVLTVTQQEGWGLDMARDSLQPSDASLNLVCTPFINHGMIVIQ